MTHTSRLPVHDSWQEPLAPVADQIHAMGDFLRAEREYLPRGNDILRAFADPFDEVRVLILGQDPYPTPGHPMGLSFSTQPGVAPPRSLVNIYKELHSDLGIAPRADGDLSSWASQGILLLNRVLTVRPGAPASHRGKGWEAVTEAAIRALGARRSPLVAILWGRDAQSAARFLGDTPMIESAHPSPLSASRGFFGSRPFSRANELLVSQGADPVDWSL
ncbi:MULTISPECIES: uracil-DNA glycosylase [Corynebacterium]|uniref:Uracil-DNA glycosylase n=1 Tax=Corynebacterium lipophiloflavum (strain ATCC 700352 / DSM 44291 / CCUG 37336 / JCM 10383 / DMMZ 1944) TaxID=525263 RepID=C0XPP4_CORLD|nr:MULTISPECIES: uracil-DNA glycosylase [Corynebacterium]EEI17790.1 uracil-DNA glycosylase [Corynebacterium lipophiloflavum DSM 44291]MCT1500072.1 uracil-DNA glycosylase [Corynebacterium sanguinis]